MSRAYSEPREPQSSQAVPRLDTVDWAARLPGVSAGDVGRRRCVRLRLLAFVRGEDAKLIACFEEGGGDVICTVVG
jgi:hypothetical protein